MNEDFAKKVRSAAVAGWWTLLIASLFLLVQWIVYLVVMRCHPAYMLRFWGAGDVSWPFIQTLWLWITAIFKMIIWVLALVVIWLSLWARGLRKS